MREAVEFLDRLKEKEKREASATSGQLVVFVRTVGCGSLPGLGETLERILGGVGEPTWRT